MLRLWQVHNMDSLSQVEGLISQSESFQLPLVNAKPFKEWANVHSSDIFEINWSPKDPSSQYLLSVSADRLVVIWSINKDKPI